MPHPPVEADRLEAFPLQIRGRQEGPVAPLVHDHQERVVEGDLLVTFVEILEGDADGALDVTFPILAGGADVEDRKGALFRQPPLERRSPDRRPQGRLEALAQVAERINGSYNLIDLLNLILVATADRPRLLSGCLESLASSSFASAEVLVLDQSREPAEPSAGAWQGSDLELRHVRCPRRGKSAALNLGIAQARGSLLAFTDDDCRVARDWLEVMERADRESLGQCALTGRVSGGEPEGNAAVAPSLREDAKERTYRAPICRDVLFGNNMALPAEILRKVGPFDEGLGPGTEAPAAEDNDLGYRLLRSGFPIRYLPGMVVTHRFWRGDEEQVGLYRGYGVGQGAFYAKHARRGDLAMLARLARSLWDAGRDAGGAVVLGRRYDFRTSTAFAAGLLRGFLRSARPPGSEDKDALVVGGR